MRTSAIFLRCVCGTNVMHVGPTSYHVSRTKIHANSECPKVRKKSTTATACLKVWKECNTETECVSDKTRSSARCTHTAHEWAFIGTVFGSLTDCDLSLSVETFVISVLIVPEL